MSETSERWAALAPDCEVQPGARVGVRYGPDAKRPFQCGPGCVVRSYAVIYADTTFGEDVQTGHFAVVREGTTVGSHVVIGTGAVIEGETTIGDYVKIESQVYIPTHTRIGNYVFIGPNAVLTNDKYPLRRRSEYRPTGPVLEDHVSVGANAVVMPGIRIGRGSIVAAGAVVTRDVPPWSLVRGVPGRAAALPKALREENRALSW